MITVIIIRVLQGNGSAKDNVLLKLQFSVYNSIINSMFYRNKALNESTITRNMNVSYATF